MPKPLVFLCFDVAHDEAARGRFVSELAEGSRSFSIDHWSKAAQSPRIDWDNLTRTNISRCDVMIVLVGGLTSAASDVGQELAFAKRANVPFFGVYAGEADATPGGLPDGLSANRTTKWDWAQIDSAVKQLMAEGKHYSMNDHK